LGELDAYRVELLDGSQVRRFALADQGALGDQGAADAAGDRRRRRGVLEVEPGPGQRGLGLLVARRCLVIFLLADGLDFEQRLEAVEAGGGAGQVGFGGGQVGL
jgi:hypothetical protein